MSESSTPDSETSTLQSIRTLLDGLVDYAGLFPPSKLPMSEAVSNYARYRDDDHAWMLGRFIVPVSRLDEFEAQAEGLLPKDEDADPWFISALTGDSLDADINRIFEFNMAHAQAASGAAVIDTIELRLSADHSVDQLMRIIPEQLQPFIEVPNAGDLRGLITSIAGTGAHAKIRCGGVTPDLIPPINHVAQFISTCAAGGVAFKATAGLHHPVRSDHALTYESESPRGTMHGFLNVFLAAVSAKYHHLDAQQIHDILSISDAAEFVFGEDGVRIVDLELDNTRLAHARESFAISFGSCSFEEPIADLKALGLLPNRTTSRN